MAGLAAWGGLALSPASVSAQGAVNLLADPGAEQSTPGSETFVGWTQWGGASFFVGSATDPGAAAYEGTNYFKMYGNYSQATDYDGFFQTFGAHAGEVFTADAWVYQSSGDNFGTGGNNAVLEVTFIDINGNTVGRYRSAQITKNSISDTWYDLQVTNRYDPVTYALLGSVTNLVAPANTVQVEYDIVFELVNYGGGSIYLDDMALNSFSPPPPYVTNLAPANVIQATNQNFTFSAVAVSGNVTNVQATVTSVSGLVYPTTNVVTYTLASTNLTVTGLNTPAVNVSLPLASNLSYTVTVLAVDSNGGDAVGTTTFDTIVPVYVFEAEDFNYNGGMWTNTPPDGGVNVLAGQGSSPGIDDNWIPAGGQTDLYRPESAVSMGGAYETPRQKFLNAVADGNTNALDYEVGYNNQNDWEDYTRVFPTGNFNIYARMAVDGQNNQVQLALVGGDTTTSSQTVTNLGVCNVSGNNWNGYFYCPLVDAFGNLVTVHLGGQQTIRSTVTSGGPNINFYMVVPATGSPYPALISSYPTGAHPFEPTNQFSFAVGPASGSPIDSSAIHLKLNGIDVTSQLTIAAGPANSWTGTLPISPNTIYSAVITVTNTTSLHSTFTINFDTFSQNNFMWEAEDYDFNGGEFIDNPVPSYDPTISGGGLLEAGSYCGYPDGVIGNQDVTGVDDNWSFVSGSAQPYRAGVVATQVASDYLRQKFTDAATLFSDPNIADVNIGYWDAGFWLNYTRTYPTNTFYIYGRLAGGAGPFSGTTLAIVTNGVGTSTQGTNILGSFADPNAAGWQAWHWVPLEDANSNLVTVALGGVETLQIESGNNLNANYYMLVPAPATPGRVMLTAGFNGLGQPVISFPTQAGHNYTLYYKNHLTDATWTSLTSVAGDGTTKALPDATATGVAQRLYRVQIQ